MNDRQSKCALSFWVIIPSSVCSLDEKNYKAFVSHTEGQMTQREVVPLNSLRLCTKMGRQSPKQN